MTRVIVADDDPKIADYYFTELFELYGVTVDVASNGRELVQQVLDGGYDFAITDYNMPEMNGLEAVSVIRDRGINIPILDILHKNKNFEMKLSLEDFLTLSAATTIKLRTRMTMLYFYAEQKNYLVIGTTNKSESLVGNFVKYGDGGVDVEPLANLYKTQIFQLSNFLKIPKEIIEQEASPDTWSYPISDEDFFYGMPYSEFDLLLYAKENDFPIENVSRSLKLEKDRVEQIYLNIEQKIKNSQHMREMPPKWNSVDSVLKK